MNKFNTICENALNENTNRKLSTLFEHSFYDIYDTSKGKIFVIYSNFGQSNTKSPLDVIGITGKAELIKSKFKLSDTDEQNIITKFNPKPFKDNILILTKINDANNILHMDQNNKIIT